MSVSGLQEKVERNVNNFQLHHFLVNWIYVYKFELLLNCYILSSRKLKYFYENITGFLKPVFIQICQFLGTASNNMTNPNITSESLEKKTIPAKIYEIMYIYEDKY